MMELLLAGGVVAALWWWKSQSGKKVHNKKPAPPAAANGTEMQTAFWGVGERQGMRNRIEDFSREAGEPVASYRAGNNPYKQSIHAVDMQLEAQASQIEGFTPTRKTPSHVFNPN